MEIKKLSWFDFLAVCFLFVFLILINISKTKSDSSTLEVCHYSIDKNSNYIIIAFGLFIIINIVLHFKRRNN